MDPKALGRRGEALAALYLQRRGWRVLDRNVRAGRREVDLIVRRGPVLAFVEVKTRRGMGFGHPLEAITPAKRGEIASVARAWIREHPQPPGTHLRFDAVAVVVREGEAPELLHVPNAWTLEGRPRGP